MTARARALIGLLVVVALLGVGLGLRALLFERVETTRDEGFSGQAALNPLLALERLLERMGVEAQSVRGFARLPPTDHVLLVAPPRRSLGEAGATRLLDWAARGGHLVVLAQPDGDELDDVLLAPLPVLLHRLPVSEADREKALARARIFGLDDEDDIPKDAKRGDRVDLEELFDLKGALRLRHVGWEEPLAMEGSEDEATLLRYPHGEGLVTVLAEADFLHSESIGEADHALRAWNALVHDDAPAGAWLVFRDKRPSPWVLLAGRARPVVVALALLLGAWLWKSAARFGPLLTEELPERRSLAEHLRAAGQWQWRCHAQRALIDAEREALRRTLARGHDGSFEELAREAGKQAGLDEARVEQALSTRAPQDRQEFTRVVRTLEALRRSTR